MITSDILKSTFNRYVSSFVDGEVFHQGTIVGVLKTCAGSDGNYRLVLKALTGKTSSKLLSPAEWYALYKFVTPIKPEGGKWHSKHTNEELTRWCNMLVYSTIDVPEQMNFLEDTIRAISEASGVPKKYFDDSNAKIEKEIESVQDDAEYIAWLYGGDQ